MRCVCSATSPRSIPSGSTPTAARRTISTHSHSPSSASRRPGRSTGAARLPHSPTPAAPDQARVGARWRGSHAGARRGARRARVPGRRNRHSSCHALPAPPRHAGRTLPLFGTRPSSHTGIVQKPERTFQTSERARPAGPAKRAQMSRFLCALRLARCLLSSWHGDRARRWMDEPERHRRCREKFDGGELPRLAPERILINEGIGERCALCDEEIPMGSTEYELQFALRYGFARTELVSFRLHPPCFQTWLIERAP